jgi:hypothetical protein
MTAAAPPGVAARQLRRTLGNLARPREVGPCEHPSTQPVMSKPTESQEILSRIGQPFLLRDPLPSQRSSPERHPAVRLPRRSCVAREDRCTEVDGGAAAGLGGRAGRACHRHRRGRPEVLQPHPATRSRSASMLGHAGRRGSPTATLAGSGPVAGANIRRRLISTAVEQQAQAERMADQRRLMRRLGSVRRSARRTACPVEPSWLAGGRRHRFGRVCPARRPG